MRMLVVVCGAVLALAAGCGTSASAPAVSTTVLKPVVTPPAVLSAEPDQPPADAAELAVVEVAAPIENPNAEVETLAFTLMQFQRIKQLQESDVHSDLKLTPQQIQRFATEAPQVTRMVNELQRMPHEGRAEKVRTEFTPHAKRLQLLIEKELTAGQQQKLFLHVVRSQRGAVALILPGVPEHLQMTESQRTGICKIIDDNMRNVKVENINNPIEVLKLIRKGAQSREAAENLLSPEQRRKWNTLLGK